MKGYKTYLLAGAALLVFGAADAKAQQTSSTADQDKKANSSADQPKDATVGEVLVTGSRIRQATDTTTPAPVAVVNPQAIESRGYVAVGQALGELTTMRPRPASGTAADGLNGQGAIGADYPNLFNLGAGRTLTLVNGRRTVATSGGLGDEAVDANIIPVGLIKRVDVVQGGGAVVYGSGAIAGVVNYILDDHFRGLQLDAQVSDTTKWDYPTGSFRLTGGTDFLAGRGNVALNLEFSNTGFIRKWERPETDATTFPAPNPAPGAGTNGIPAQVYVSHFFSPTFDPAGVVVGNPALLGSPSLLLVNGQPVRFSNDGTSLLPYNPGTTIPGLPYGVNGGDHDPKTEDGGAGAVVPKVTRFSANLVGHYDLTDHIKVSTELTFAQVVGDNVDGRLFLTTFVNYLAAIPALRPLTFTKDNAFLTPTEVAQLSAASPAFAAGGALVNGKGDWSGLYGGSADAKTTTDTYRGLVGLDGDFNMWGRNFYWSASYSHGEAHFLVSGLYPASANLRRAIDAVRLPSGQIVCRVNADTDPTNDAPGCVPIDMFGNQPISAAARNYVMVQSGTNVFSTNFPSVNKQDDALLTLSGKVFDLPTGPVQFSAAYEFRNQSESLTPLTADQLGLVFNLQPIPSAAGSFTTNEISGELQVPIIGKDFTLPFVQELNLSGSYRFVDHSLAGTASVYGAGLRWKVTDGLVLRASYSRNFRAPNLSQLILPASSANGAVTNPCGNDQISLGPNPAVRRANCLALFQANPTFGTGPGLGVTQTTPAGAPADVRLANFVRTTIGGVVVTTRGNPNLTNEYADTTTFGFVFQPSFIPGLLITADRIKVDLTDAIVPFSPTQFAQGCFDASPPQAQLCNGLSYDSSGQIIAAPNTSVNAGSYLLKADTVVVNYNLPLERIFADRDWGALNFGLQVTHNRLESSTIAGTTTRTDGTQNLPKVVAKFDLNYTKGPLKLYYSAYYLDKVKLSFDATVANSPNGLPNIDSNLRHNISGSYDIGRYTVRAGINNLTDERPSFPTSTYGDLIGRTVFVGLRANF